MSTISFTHLRYAGTVAMDKADAFKAKLDALRAEAYIFCVLPPKSGFTNIIIAGDQTSGSKLEQLLTEFHLHWKQVLGLPNLHFSDGSVNHHAVGNYVVEVFGGEELPFVGGENFSGPSVNEEEVVFIPSGVARTGGAETFIGGVNRSEPPANEENSILFSPEVAARFTSDFASIFGSGNAGPKAKHENGENI